MVLRGARVPLKLSPQGCENPLQASACCGGGSSRLRKDVSESMDELIERLADALRKEFPFLDGPKTGADAFQKAAAGIVQKMGLVHFTMQVHGGDEPIKWEIYTLPHKED